MVRIPMRMHPKREFWTPDSAPAGLLPTVMSPRGLWAGSTVRVRVVPPAGVLYAIGPVDTVAGVKIGRVTLGEIANKVSIDKWLQSGSRSLTADCLQPQA